MAETTTSIQEEQDILKAIPSPTDLKILLNEENTKRNGEAKTVALLFLKEITDLLKENKEDILKGGSISIELNSDDIATKYDTESPDTEMLQRISDEIQRTLEGKTYNTSCKVISGEVREVTIQLVHPLE